MPLFHVAVGPTNVRILSRAAEGKASLVSGSAELLPVRRNRLLTQNRLPFVEPYTRRDRWDRRRGGCNKIDRFAKLIDLMVLCNQPADKQLINRSSRLARFRSESISAHHGFRHFATTLTHGSLSPGKGQGRTYYVRVQTSSRTAKLNTNFACAPRPKSLLWTTGDQP